MVLSHNVSKRTLVTLHNGKHCGKITEDEIEKQLFFFALKYDIHFSLFSSPKDLPTLFSLKHPLDEPSPLLNKTGSKFNLDFWCSCHFLSWL